MGNKNMKTKRNQMIGIGALLVVTACAMVSSVVIKNKLSEKAPAFTGTLTAGEYQGTAKGFGGDIVATVVVSDSKIESITVAGDSETPGIGSNAIDTMPGAMVEAQSTDVDMVSGATFSSTGIIEAVKDALAQAGAEF